jgi:hypothetical protein
VRKLLKVIQKNFKLIIRSRTSALIIIFGPLLITLLVGMAFNNAALYSINIGIYSPTYNDFVQSFIDRIEEAQFKIEQLESKDICIESIRQGTSNICMIFPEDFEVATSDNPDAQN